MSSARPSLVCPLLRGPQAALCSPVYSAGPPVELRLRARSRRSSSSIVAGSFSGSAREPLVVEPVSRPASVVVAGVIRSWSFSLQGGSAPALCWSFPGGLQVRVVLRSRRGADTRAGRSPPAPLAWFGLFRSSSTGPRAPSGSSYGPACSAPVLGPQSWPPDWPLGPLGPVGPWTTRATLALFLVATVASVCTESGVERPLFTRWPHWPSFKPSRREKYWVSDPDLGVAHPLSLSFFRVPCCGT